MENWSRSVEFIIPVLDQSPRNPVDLWIPGGTMLNLAAKIAMRDRVHATDHEECGSPRVAPNGAMGVFEQCYSDWHYYPTRLQRSK